MAKSKLAVYPAPVVIEPLLEPHKHTFILLHGRGSNGPKFGPELISHLIPWALITLAVAGDIHPPPDEQHTTTLRDLFPYAKFIFPTAAPRRATIYKRSIIHQWFDNWHLTEDPDARPDLMGEGLRASTAFIRGLVQEEALKLGRENVILGGLSQGCATALITMLLEIDGESGIGDGDKDNGSRVEIPVAGVVGMSGWLPFARDMEDLASGRDIYDIYEDLDDPFDRSEDIDGESSAASPITKALLHLQSEIDLASTVESSCLTQPHGLFQDSGKSIPFFLGHGTEDERIPLYLARRMPSCLIALGAGDVEWKEYEGLGHWYSGDMLADIVRFVKDKVGWETA
ncbi:hypothetical protein AJ80_07731 [Polytolypa hystricis UAMH7299]|uniref:Phospholipase/carboxylesterase/thioesterase domain-containing protein n=1 Tax=Polytolypa hystricis (strain UAMH7299) TaxID=1447883 RepID=A0A2B7XJ92_POLH7|nr:hypothetical protein AJ80_07731 [Polytolypa hystricis UAMH7299]